MYCKNHTNGSFYIAEDGLRFQTQWLHLYCTETVSIAELIVIAHLHCQTWIPVLRKIRSRDLSLSEHVLM